MKKSANTYYFEKLQKLMIESSLAPFTEKPIFEYSIPLIDRQAPGASLEVRNELILIMKDFIQKRIPYENARDRYIKAAGNASAIEKIRDVIQMPTEIIKVQSDSEDSDEKNRRKMQKWSTYEDNRLLAAIYRFGIDNWALIAKFVGNNRTRAQCAQRWTRCLNPRICKDTWEPREDSLLLQLVQRFGDHSWTKVAEYLGNRSDVQCRYRYTQISRELHFQKMQATPSVMPQMAGNMSSPRVAFPQMSQSKAMDSGAIQLQPPKIMAAPFQHRYSMPVIQVIHTYVYADPMQEQQVGMENPSMLQMQPQMPMPQPQPRPAPIAQSESQLDSFLTKFQH